MTGEKGGPPFWEAKSLGEMTRSEWESLCDGCARCCLNKLEDEDTGELFYTRVVCELLDTQSCQCTDYQNRSVRVPTCVTLTPDNLDDVHFMPSTCAYRRLHEGLPLLYWHPLVSGSAHSVHNAGASVRGRCISEAYVHEDGLEEHIVTWVD